MDPGKYSFRPRRATIERGLVLATVVCLLLATRIVGAQDDARADDAAPAEPGEELLDRFLERVHSLAAEFDQELWSANRELIETAEGSLSLERPNRFAWHYRTPIEQQIVADGKRLWMYDVELEQVTVTELDELGAANPAMLLSGDRGVRDDFDIVESFVLDGRDWVRLTPRQAGTDFSSVSIGFIDGLPQVLEFVDGLDQTTRIAFSEVELNPDLETALFDFVPPPGVDVIGDSN